MGGLRAFRETLAELGWVEGRNLHIESRSAGGPGDNVTTLAAELVASVQVIVAAPSHGIRAAKEATHRRRLTRFVLRNKLPAVSLYPAYPEAGFLMSYGTNIVELYGHAARYVDRVLKGAAPADLPVEQLTKYELVVNLKAARRRAGSK